MARGTRTVVVRRRTTVLLLILWSLLILLLTIWLTGKAYAKVDPVPFRDFRLLYRKMGHGLVPMPTLVALITPTVLNVLLFIPWGFLMFIALDKPERPTSQSYLLTLLLAIAFSGGIEAWQYFLPTRVTDVNDLIANGMGSLVGGVFGHLRKRVRLSFE